MPTISISASWEMLRRDWVWNATLVRNSSLVLGVHPRERLNAGVSSFESQTALQMPRRRCFFFLNHRPSLSENPTVHAHENA